MKEKINASIKINWKSRNKSTSKDLYVFQSSTILGSPTETCPPKIKERLIDFLAIEIFKMQNFNFDFIIIEKSSNGKD